MTRFRGFIIIFLILAKTSLIRAQWSDVSELDSTLLLDLRYATPHNFAGEQLYPCARCYLRPEAAEALIRVHKRLQKEYGYGLRLYDCYRPAPVQKKLWDQFPNPNYVTPPWKGSNHNRGLAVDVGLTDSCGVEYPMGSDFDHLGKRSHHDYLNLSDEILERRRILKRTMKTEGFSSIRTEWWHYNYYQVKYAVDDFVWSCD